MKKIIILIFALSSSFVFAKNKCLKQKNQLKNEKNNYLQLVKTNKAKESKLSNKILQLEIRLGLHYSKLGRAILIDIVSAEDKITLNNLKQEREALHSSYTETVKKLKEARQNRLTLYKEIDVRVQKLRKTEQKYLNCISFEYEISP